MSHTLRWSLQDTTVIECTLDDMSSFYSQDVFSGSASAIANRNRAARVLFVIVSKLSRLTIFNYFMLIALVLFYNVFRFPESGRRIFFYGLSKNNRVSFEKLKNCLGSDIGREVSENYRALTVKEKFRLLLRLRLFWQASAMLAHRSSSNPYVHAQMMIAAAACVVYLSVHWGDELSIVCVANDHSPVPRTLLRLCQKKNIKSVYIQHAPVTRYFPPLISDLSILYDRISVFAYEQAAKRTGAQMASGICLLPPFASPFVAPSVGAEPVTVGICLSRLPRLEGLRKLLLLLTQDPRVDSVVLRHHPACNLNLSSLTSFRNVVMERKGTLIAKFLKSIDLVLVPSSGVALECLHNGVPALYISGTDEVPEDYYGFVSAGVMPALEEVHLDHERINSFFDDSWVTLFADYDATVIKPMSEYREAVFRALSRLLNESASPYCVE